MVKFKVHILLLFDHTCSKSSSRSLDDSHTRGDVVIFVRHGLFFSKLSTSTLSSFDSYSSYVGVKILLNSSSPLFFSKFSLLYYMFYISLFRFCCFLKYVNSVSKINCTTKLCTVLDSFAPAITI